MYGLLRSVQLWFHDAACIRETFDISNDLTALQTSSSDEENKDENGKGFWLARSVYTHWTSRQKDTIFTTQKLWEGNFSQVSVRHSVHRDGSHGRYTLMDKPYPRLTLTPYIPTSPESASCYWHLVVITGDLFKLVHLRPYLPHHYWHLVVTTKTGTVACGRFASYWKAVWLLAIFTL